MMPERIEIGCLKRKMVEIIKFTLISPKTDEYYDFSPSTTSKKKAKMNCVERK